MDDALVIANRLCKEGYGTMTQILEQPIDLTLAALEYCTFISEYEQTAHELNKPTK